MKEEVVILLAEDDKGHAELVRRNLRRAGVQNEIIHFPDGDAILDYLYAVKHTYMQGNSYLLLLDIRMPKTDGVEVLRRIKADDDLKKLPVIMVTTTDDPHEIDRCHDIGCNNYITKPVEYEKFMNAIRKLGMFLEVIEIPELKIIKKDETS